MKTPLFAVACAGIGAAGIFSFMKVGTHQAELDATVDTMAKVVNVENAYDGTQKDYDSQKDLYKKAEDGLNKTKAEVEIKEGEKLTLKRDLNDLDKKVAAQEEKIEEVVALINTVKNIFDGEKVELSEVPAFIKKLNTEKETLAKESEELTLALEQLQKNLDESNADIVDLNKRETQRIKSLRQNSISSLITAVNNSWGFVVIKPHPNAIIDTDSNMIIVRGAQHIGRLDISAVEANRVIADIDFDSLVSGARVRAGDRVILAKANSR